MFKLFHLNRTFSSNRARIAAGQQFATSLDHSLMPVGKWNFDEGSGTIAYDSSGNGNNGSLNGNTKYKCASDDKNNTPSGQGCSLYFDGSGDYVDFSDNYFKNKFTDQDDFSIAAWVKLDNTNTDKVIVGQRYGDSMVFGVRSDGKLFLNMDDTRGSSPKSSTKLNIDKWHFVVVSFKGSDGSHLANFYIDGESAGLGSAYDGNGSGSQSNFYVGYESRFGKIFKGFIGQVSVYEQTLDLACVKALYAQKKQKYFKLVAF